MAKKRCNRCVGSGRVMGGGMMMQDCDECDGTGKIIVLDDTVMKTDSKEYKNALDNIKGLSGVVSDEEAKKLLDDELTKLKNESNVLKLKEKRKTKDGEPNR